MLKFETENLAVAALIEGKKPDCVEALEKGFWQARGEGLDIRESYERAEFVHFLNDHDGLSHTPGDFPLKSDEDVHAHAQKGVELAQAAKEEDALELVRIFFHWYDLYRSWGGDVFLSYTGATSVLTEIYEERHDLDEADALSKIETFPIASLKNVAVASFKASRTKGNTVRQAIRDSKEAVEWESLTNRLFPGFVN